MRTQNIQDRFKGQDRTVLVIGGSDLYTGAPYFAARAALKTGMELCYIMTHGDASLISLKTLLPDAVVTKIEYLPWILNRINICIIGPGLGRVSEKTETLILLIFYHLQQKNVPIIFDGDGIRLFANNKLYMKIDRNCWLTPNINESRYISEINSPQICIIKKGPVDIIVFEGKTTQTIRKGSLKRCAGQGDILTGILASHIIFQKNRTPDFVARYACDYLRSLASTACAKFGSSLTASNIIKQRFRPLNY